MYEIILIAMTNNRTNDPPTITAFASMFPAVFFDEIPKIIRNSEKIIPTNVNAFILLFNRKNPRRARRQGNFEHSVFDLYLAQVPKSIF